MNYKIKVDAERVIGKIDPNIYGHLVEHLGRCIYGGIYEENSALSDENGFRKDVLKAVRSIKCPLLRWPGGNFASNYHWKDGIGPKEKRPVRFDLAWSKEETNRFGTDEFIEYCRAVKAEPYDGLFAAGVFITMHKLCQSVTMANLAQLVNVLGAIHTDRKGLYLTPIYRAFDLFVNHTGEIVLDVLINSESYNIEGKALLGNRKFKLSNVPYLDASATLSRSKDKLCIAAVNYHLEEDIECSISLEGFSLKEEAKVYELNGPDVMAVNDFDNPERISIKDKTIKNISPGFSYVFPAHSATIIELKVK